MDVRCPAESVSFLYLNPPYDLEVGQTNNQRMELVFLEHTYRWLKPGGVLIFVIPQSQLVLTNTKGGPANRRNLLRRHLKPTLKKLGLPASVDFRSFRTMHSSLMSSIGVRPEVTRDNMGHANIDVTQNVYNRTWWEERVEAVSMAAATVWRELA
jgi:integrase